MQTMLSLNNNLNDLELQLLIMRDKTQLLDRKSTVMLQGITIC